SGKSIHFVTITDNEGKTLVKTNKDEQQNSTQHEDHLLIKKTLIGDESLHIGEIEIGFSRQAAQEKLDTALSNQIRIGLISLIFAMLIAYMLGTVLTRRLKLLEQGASTIRRGDLGFQIEASGQDEIGRTATAFNMMSQHVNELYNEQEKVNSLLTILNNAQTRYIQSDNQHAIFEELLDDIISITKSEYGFLGEILYTKENKPYLHTFAITDISWDAESKALYQNNHVTGFEFYNLNTLFGSAIESGLPVISNDPTRDPRASGIPSGHPDLNAFLGMPLYSGKSLVGLIGLANRKEGYNQKILEELQALWQVSSSIIISHMAEQERKKIESELRESEERFSLVAQGTNDGMWDWNLKTGDIYYSTRWRDMLSYNDSEITHRFDEWQALIHPDDLGDALNIWTECMEGTLKTFSFEYRVKNKLDTYLWILCRGTVFKNSEGKAIRMAGSHTDITTQKENEIALKESAERTQAIFDNVSDTILTLDNSGTIEECNPSIKDSFDYTPEQIIGTNISTLVNIPQGATDIDNLIKTFHINNETVGIKQDGENFPIDIELSEISDENQDRSLIFVIRDITERKKTETAIHKAHEAAIDAARTKSEFLANMSHEIRTPLHGILGMLQLTENTRLDEKQKNYISTATTSANHLLNVINDILDFSKIEAGKLDLEYIPFNLRDLLEDITHLYASQALSKNIQLEQLMPANINNYYYGDPARLKQIFNNLVSNAIKFTQHGSVLLKVKVLSTMKDEATLQIEVADTGIGISAQAQEKIFSSFQQADNTMARKYGGTGLGLAICKQLSELMNADLNISSTEEKGSRFILNITMKTAKNITPYMTDPLKGRRALTLNTDE
ncbi:MAG: ATP-binding protein, partial [Gammaproteobacteria bacterium]|nr:ATP-binding protein [Gammaproteobacteria bacterium]